MAAGAEPGSQTGSGSGWPVMSLAQANAQLTAPGATFEMAECDVRGHRLRVWKNAPPTLRESFITGRSHGEACFLVYEDERVSFEAFARAALAVAATLQARGIRKGDRVAILMRNLPEWPVALYGALLIGAIGTPLNAWGTAVELQYALADSGARVAFADAERWAKVAPLLDQCPDLEQVFVSRTGAGVAIDTAFDSMFRSTRDQGAAEDGSEASPAQDVASTAAPVRAEAAAVATGRCRVESLESLIGTPNEWAGLPPGSMPHVELDPDDDATIFYTSGTTGRAKGVIGTHRNATTILMASPYGAMRNLLRRGAQPPDPATLPQGSVLLSIPFFHTTGCHVILNGALNAGAKLVMMRRWDAVRAMELIERERCTVAGGVPTIAWQLLEHPDRDRYDLSSLHAVSYGGAPAAAELAKQVGKVFGHTAPATGWGMTETSATFTHHAAEEYLSRPDSAGPAMPVCSMRIVDDEGRDLPVGERGELLVQGPGVARGYWNKPTETAQSFVDGWLRTGDIARLDEEGYLYILDRKKEMLIRGGENIFCPEVEAALYEHPAVIDAGVVGIPHHSLGEEPAAVVALAQDAHVTEEELRAFVRERLAAFKVPVRIRIVDETLPRNPSGKLMRKELKKLLLPEQGPSTNE